MLYSLLARNNLFILLTLTLRDSVRYRKEKGREKMKVIPVRSDSVYKKIMEAPFEKKNDIYRYEMMMPFEKKWACYNVPMKASTLNGYDVIMASGMLGHIAPTKVDESQRANIKVLSSDNLWNDCELSIKNSLNCFIDNGVELPVQDYLFTILLANAESPYITMNEGYCGDGGIPGYIFSWLVPNEYTLKHLPVALAHEVNHNVRFQFIRWKNDITLGEMMVSEGLAENFATYIYGEDKVGPWVTKTDMQTLNEYIKPIIHDGLRVQGLENLNAYLYGDEMATLQNYPTVGLPYCAGYACGYHLVKHYLKNTVKSNVEATLLPASEMLEVEEDFRND